MNEITFAVLLTAAGAGIAAGIVTGTVEVLKHSVPPLAQANGATLAFALSAVLYVLAAIATSVASLDAALGVFVAWLTCATAAVGIHRTVVRPIEARMTTAPDATAEAADENGEQ